MLWVTGWTLEKGDRFSSGLASYVSRNGLVYLQWGFIDEKPGFYEFGGEREKITRDECFAKFAAGDCEE